MLVLRGLSIVRGKRDVRRMRDVSKELINE